MSDNVTPPTVAYVEATVEDREALMRALMVEVARAVTTAATRVLCRRGHLLPARGAIVADLVRVLPTIDIEALTFFVAREERSVTEYDYETARQEGPQS